MKKKCPYCNSGSLTVKNTYDDIELKKAYPLFDKAFKDARKFNPKATFFRRYYCDVCNQYIWSYEEIIHKVPTRQIGIRTPQDNTIYMYNNGEKVGTAEGHLYTQGTMERTVERMTDGTTEEERNNILENLRNM